MALERSSGPWEANDTGYSGRPTPGSTKETDPARGELSLDDSRGVGESRETQEQGQRVSEQRIRAVVVVGAIRFGRGIRVHGLPNTGSRRSASDRGQASRRKEDQGADPENRSRD